MKKIIASLFLLLLIFSLSSCSIRVYSLPSGNFCTSAADGSAVELEEHEKQYIINLLNDGKWYNEIAKCPADYNFRTALQSLTYCAEDGVFNDFTLHRSLTISEEQRLFVNGFLDYDRTEGSFHAKQLDCTFSYAGSVMNPKISKNSLNAKNIQPKDNRIPIYKFDTLAELEQFKADFGEEYGFINSYDEVPSFNDEAAKYGEEFFENNTLMLVYIVSSGSYRYGVKSIHCDGTNFTIHAEQINHPSVIDDNIASWFITVAVPDSMVERVRFYDADITHYQDNSIGFNKLYSIDGVINTSDISSVSVDGFNGSLGRPIMHNVMISTDKDYINSVSDFINNAVFTLATDCYDGVRSYDVTINFGSEALEIKFTSANEFYVNDVCYNSSIEFPILGRFDENYLYFESHDSIKLSTYGQITTLKHFDLSKIHLTHTSVELFAYDYTKDADLIIDGYTYRI